MVEPRNPDAARIRTEQPDLVRLLGASTIFEAVIATEPDGTIIYWNTGAETLYKWRAGEVIGKNIVEITPTNLSRGRARAILKELQAGSAWFGEFDVSDRDGNWFTVHVAAVPLHHTDGHISRILSLSDRVHAEDASLANDSFGPFESDAVSHLSNRQKDVLRCLGLGKSNEEIAQALSLSPNTVKIHVSAILARLGLKSRTQAALLGARMLTSGHSSSRNSRR